MSGSGLSRTLVNFSGSAGGLLSLLDGLPHVLNLAVGRAGPPALGLVIEVDGRGVVRAPGLGRRTLRTGLVLGAILFRLDDGRLCGLDRLDGLGGGV